ncbi:MAG: cysteine protease [Stictis urceolatum]|nr:cysteine protease [Stictis urceolata]
MSSSPSNDANGSGGGSESASQSKDLPTPVSPEALLTTRERVILLRGSKLHGCKFPPWRDPDPASEDVGSQWEDPTEYYLSPEQREILDGWRRPLQPQRLPETGVGIGTTNQSVPASARRQVDLVQDVTSDCSVVASLCAETARSERLGPDRESIVKATMHPSPGTSRSGKYVLKLNFNGCFRRVEIDDRLPASRVEKRALHVFDRRDSGVIWPALVEKAYLKVRGGYDFPGSNSGTDLWVLTGWIPEQLFFESDEMVSNLFWKRLYQGFNYGDVLVTMGTPRLSLREEKASGLASEHAYAVVDVREENGRRELLIKNPWSEGGTWTGSTFRSETRGLEYSKEAMMPGTFWMDLNNVSGNFETIYLNWNPGLFSHRRDVHFSWDLAARSSYGSFSNNPQYSIYCYQKTSLWILLHKHFTSFERTSDGDDACSFDPRVQRGHLSLYAYDSEYRVMLTDGALHRAPYVDAPNILLRFEAQARTHYTIVVSEQGLPSFKFDFSISVFTRSPLQIGEAGRRYNHYTVQSGAWTYTTAGGNAGSPEYSMNPQFSLSITKQSDIAIMLEAEDADLAVHVKLVWANGKRIPSKITTKDIFGDSGEYRRGCALAQIRQVNTGTYTVICSTFKQGEMSKFSLKVWSSSEQCFMRPIPIYEPGMFSVRLTPAILTQGVDRVLAPLSVLRLTRLHIRARNVERANASTNSPMKLSIEYGQGPNKAVLASTDRFIEATSGIRTPDVDVKPAMCGENAPGIWVVVERMAGSCLEYPEDVAVELLSSEQGATTGTWGREADEPIEELQRKMGASSVSSRSSG